MKMRLSGFSITDRTFASFAPHAQKGQKFQKQHALKGQKLQKQHALKGQKLLAQGIALGIIAVSKAPCKGKSFVYCLVF